MCNGVPQQRVHYRNGLVGKTPTLSRIQIRCLEEVGFRWVAAMLAIWDDRFKQLIEYKNKNVNCLVPAQYDQNPALGRWVGSQCKLYKNGQMKEERVKQLQEIGFIWSAR
eukprot:CCRYP_004190-RA/>CCRYP_004190-RA protein AED:0.29 eAED:0.29 QI:0/0.5/0.33/1/0/0/3/288/109